MIPGHDSLKTKSTLEVGNKKYSYYDLNKVGDRLGDVGKLPVSLKYLLENMLRFEDGRTVDLGMVDAFGDWLKNGGKNAYEIAYRPARVLMQDFTGVPAVVDLAAMRDAMKALGEDPEKINPLAPVDLVIDHSVMVDYFGTEQAFEKNVDREYERNKERYEFLKWGQGAFANFRVVPPGTGICHQVNLEYLGQTVWTAGHGGEEFAYPDTLVGTDSHTTMVNGLAILGWGVGGIEAEAAMLGQPVSMLIPEVVGFKVTGKMPEGATATDLVLTVTKMLRDKGVVGKFVEFYGSGLDNLTLEDRATIGNMSPEFGSTCAFFPVDEQTIDYLRKTGRDEDRIALVEAYARAQGLWRFSKAENRVEPVFTDTLELDLSTVVPVISGPKRPQDKILLTEAPEAFDVALDKEYGKLDEKGKQVAVEGEDYTLGHGDVCIAAITSCTNTSNPSVLIAAGLVAKKARELGLTRKPWVKTSLAPGSQVVTDYLERSGLQDELDGLGFNLVGYGCTTCIGNSGPLPEQISKAIQDNDLAVASVLSGNRNFEGRISQDIRANFLASPPLVVAYALAGSMNINLTKDPIAQTADGKDVFLKDIWPTSAEIAEVVSKCVTREMFIERYADVFKGDAHWQNIETSSSDTYSWPSSTYIANPPYFQGMSSRPSDPEPIEGARILALLGDSVTTDHISPAGAIAEESPAGAYLESHQVPPREFNSYGSRRGNHEVMMRGTFANIRIKNKMLDGIEGGYTKYVPTDSKMAIYDAAMKYKAEKSPLVVFGGEQYGTGSSRDWAAKGTILLGVKAVIAQSFERIHRSNLIGMGVLPLQFKEGDSWEALGLTGDEQVTIHGVESLSPREDMTVTITFANGDTKEVTVLARIDTQDELDYYRNGGILHYVIRKLAA
ncbi:aconitate hydratase 1 [Parvularcula bermudensis HTCC2503]|uniref:Aconitate hydratase n=1 Tax=Parvularcula bermudensis (strain ATCC BAA-594 / HTCC2503 / KCTC 12087) TaxID=314260 RepID=E0TE60_PARBH|nr:aconitate hydratase AcnA [Parvularcula bermudensis]ADM08881.1 aconitate hydratase 1 [Parvularcula bermudensis HTCC2503]